MKSLEKDLELARYILDDTEDCFDTLDSDRLYLRSNEPLEFIFSQFDFSSKDILSVLASSDQVFSFYQNGARSVDTFDIHRLTEYYYYLRLWCLQQYQNSFPYEFSNNSLKQVLSFTFPDFPEGVQAKKFWSTLLTEYPGLMRSSMFFSPMSASTAPFEGKEESLLVDVPDYPLSFREQDFFSSFDSNRQYDVCFMSNVLEYARGNEHKLMIARDNLDRVLKSGGIVIVTRFMDLSSQTKEKERRIFSSSFEYYPGRKRSCEGFSEGLDSYYVYRKK